MCRKYCIVHIKKINSSLNMQAFSLPYRIGMCYKGEKKTSNKMSFTQAYALLLAELAEDSV